MEYNNMHVRRQDRLLTEEEALRLLEQGEYGVLSLTTPEGEAYGIPVNFVHDGHGHIYVHCAPEGRKLRCISHNPQVSFCIVGATKVISNKFTTAYESVVLACHADTRLTAEERMQALELLLRKYSPADWETGRRYADKSFHRTAVIRLTVRQFSGKCKRVTP